MSGKHDGIINMIIEASRDYDNVKIILNNNKIINCNFFIEPGIDVTVKDGLIYILAHNPDDSNGIISDYEKLCLRLDDITGVLIQSMDVQPYERIIRVKEKEVYKGTL